MKIIFGFLLIATAVSLFAADDSEQVRFSGYNWIVKKAETPLGPGPNIFSDSSVRGNSKAVTFRIVRRDAGWGCAEIVSSDCFSYGEFTLEFSIPRELDSNAVFGFFLYDESAPPYYNEIDFEVSRWGAVENDPFSFSVQPYERPGNSLAFSGPVSGEYKCSIIWTPEKIDFRLSDMDGALIEQWGYSGEDLPVSGNSRVHMNLWLFRGSPPVDDGARRVILRSFGYRESD